MLNGHVHVHTRRVIMSLLIYTFVIPESQGFLAFVLVFDNESYWLYSMINKCYYIVRRVVNYVPRCDLCANLQTSISFFPMSMLDCYIKLN